MRGGGRAAQQACLPQQCRACLQPLAAAPPGSSCLAAWRRHPGPSSRGALRDRGGQRWGAVDVRKQRARRSRRHGRRAALSCCSPAPRGLSPPAPLLRFCEVEGPAAPTSTSIPSVPSAGRQGRGTVGDTNTRRAARGTTLPPTQPRRLAGSRPHLEPPPHHHHHHPTAPAHLPAPAAAPAPCGRTPAPRCRHRAGGGGRELQQAAAEARGWRQGRAGARRRAATAASRPPRPLLQPGAHLRCVRRSSTADRLPLMVRRCLATAGAGGGAGGVGVGAPPGAPPAPCKARSSPIEDTIEVTQLRSHPAATTAQPTCVLGSCHPLLEFFQVCLQPLDLPPLLRHLALQRRNLGLGQRGRGATWGQTGEGRRWRGRGRWRQPPWQAGPALPDLQPAHPCRAPHPAPSRHCCPSPAPAPPRCPLQTASRRPGAAPARPAPAPPRPPWRRWPPRPAPPAAARTLAGSAPWQSVGACTTRQQRGRMAGRAASGGEQGAATTARPQRSCSCRPGPAAAPAARRTCPARSRRSLSRRWLSARWLSS